MAHPRHLVAAGLVIASASGRILMVQTFNGVGDGLILPGGLVENNESPATAAVREVKEELGLELGVGRLLVVEHRAATTDRSSNLQFVFAADRQISEDDSWRLQPDEIAEAHWVDRQQVVERHAAGGRARMAAALQAMGTGVPAYIDS